MKQPTLTPFKVPWMISSVPCLDLQTDNHGAPLSVSFIAFFKLATALPGYKAPDRFQYVEAPSAFEPAASGEQEAPYRLVRIKFINGIAVRKNREYSEMEVIKEDDYDWSKMPCDSDPNEDIGENLERSARYWIETGYSPNPGFLGISAGESPWLAELGLADSDLTHYLIIGHDEYIEVAAEGAQWERGQVVD